MGLEESERRLIMRIGILTSGGAPTPGELRAGLGVEDVTGRPPRTFADWARRHAALFR